MTPPRPDGERLNALRLRIKVLLVEDDQSVETFDALLAHCRVVEGRNRDAERLADEVAVLVRRGVLDSRSPAADALLDFRDPPSSPRADRLSELEAVQATAPPDAAVAVERVRAALHRLWTKAVGTPSYEKKEWQELDSALREPREKR